MYSDPKPHRQQKNDNKKPLPHGTVKILQVPSTIGAVNPQTTPPTPSEYAGIRYSHTTAKQKRPVRHSTPQPDSHRNQNYSRHLYDQGQEH
ncbi:MAG: hypothetical protein KGZ83_13145 [Sulfuricella sp.]|nr:hypothetical protein [Sulfuricella sp.]